jgi:hypothetical protein
MNINYIPYVSRLRLVFSFSYDARIPSSDSSLGTRFRHGEISFQWIQRIKHMGLKKQDAAHEPEWFHTYDHGTDSETPR